MGVDFIKKCAKGFEKSWDRGKRELAAPSLFSHDPALAARTYCVTPTAGAALALGSEFLLRSVDSELRLYDGPSVVGAIKDGPPSLVAAINGDGCGVALAKVVHLHEFSGAADVVVA